MSHPLEDVINQADGFVIVGDSSENRFPAFSYRAYTDAGKRFYCVDLGGLTESRGPLPGGKVYPSFDDLPAEHGDLAILWVKPKSALRAVELVHGAGCKRVWFSFQTGHPQAVARARELGLEVVEIGRCPVYYLDDKPPACKAHTLMTRLSGTWKQPPQLDENAAKRKELF